MKTGSNRSKQRTLLIDGDVLLYRFGFANQSAVEWEAGVVSEWETPDLAIASLDEFVAHLQERTSCAKKEPIVCLSGPSKTMFRYTILSSYKHNRKDKEKPRLYQLLKDHILENYNVSKKENLEADDCLGILSTKKPDRFVVTTIDKDLAQVPGLLFNWDKDNVPKQITKEEADKYFYKQILSGDPVDGYSGVPGIGVKKADKIIDTLYDEVGGSPSPGEVWETILEVYGKKDLDESYALTMARMARILRAEDWDSERQEPILWTPHK